MQTGEPFPGFGLGCSDGSVIDDATFENVRHVVFFYDTNDSEDSLTEAMEFTANYPKFMMRNIALIGVNSETPEANREFMMRNGLKFLLLSDTDRSLSKKAGVLKDGIISRSTFLVGKDGLIEASWNDVKAEGHARTVLKRALTYCKCNCISGTD